MKNLIRNIEPFVNGLEQMQLDVSMKSDQAQLILDKLKGKHFLSHLHYFSDVLNVLNKYSKILQGNEHSIINLQPNIKSLMNDLDKFKITNFEIPEGLSALKDFLSKCKYGRASNPPNLKQYESTAKVRFGDIELKNDYSGKYKISGSSTQIIDDIITSLTRDYSDTFDEINLFSFLSPYQFPDIITYNSDYGRVKLLHLFNYLGLTSDLKSTDVFPVLVKTIKENPQWNLLKSLKAEKFWGSIFLDKQSFQMTANLNRVIRLSISIPASNSVCERGFSVMGMLLEVIIMDFNLS